METIFLIILIGLAGGIAVGIQSPMASMIRTAGTLRKRIHRPYRRGDHCLASVIDLWWRKAESMAECAVVCAGSWRFRGGRDRGDQFHHSACGRCRGDHHGGGGTNSCRRTDRSLRLAGSTSSSHGFDARDWFGSCSVWGLVDGEVIIVGMGKLSIPTCYSFVTITSCIKCA